MILDDGGRTKAYFVIFKIFDCFLGIRSKVRGGFGKFK